jgi:hypothetical protein
MKATSSRASASRSRRRRRSSAGRGDGRPGPLDDRTSSPSSPRASNGASPPVRRPTGWGTAARDARAERRRRDPQGGPAPAGGLRIHLLPPAPGGRREAGARSSRSSPRCARSPWVPVNHPNPAIGLFIRLSRSPAARSVPRLSIWHEYDEELAAARERVRT